jgi:hypothetical protein
MRLVQPAAPPVAVVLEALAATPPQPPPRAQPMVLAMVSLPRLPQAAEAAQITKDFYFPHSVQAAPAEMRPRMQ